MPAVPLPRTPDEALLEAAQRKVTQGELADLQRKDVMRRLYDEGMTQRELAERMTRAAVAAGGEPLSSNAVYKLLRRVRLAEARNGEVAS